MEHHGGPIDPKGFCIAFKKQECHLEYDKRFENQRDRNGTSVFPYVGCRDYYGPGELVWFDTEAEGWDFVKAVYEDAVNYAVVRNTLLFPEEKLLEHNRLVYNDNEKH